MYASPCRLRFAAMAATLLAVGAPRAAQAADATHVFALDGRERSYVVHEPADWDAATSAPLPVVLIFHGGGGNAEQMRRMCGLDAKADTAGFLAVYPNGTGRFRKLLTWNAGDCCAYAERESVDDVGFVRALLDDLEVRYPLDARCVFATGMSNGGMMSFRLAAELSDRIAAVAPVSGGLQLPSIAAARPVPIIYFHGTADHNAPFGGGEGDGLAGILFTPVEETVATWRKVNGCAADPVVEKLPDIADDGMTVERRTYGACNADAEIVLVVVEGGGHAWPGRPMRLRKLGESTRDISANDMMWDFFQRHPMPPETTTK